MVYGRDGYKRTGYKGEENIKKDVWTGGSARNMENKNQSGIEGAIYVQT
jgi:hypothetical protein